MFANKCPQSACINGEVRIPIIPLVSLGYMPQVIKSQFMTLSIVRRVYRMKRSNNGRAKANRIFEFQVSFVIIMLISVQYYGYLSENEKYFAI